MRIDRVKFVAALARTDLSSKQLAQRSGVSRVTVSAVKNGKRCRADTANKLAAGLGVDPAEIIEEG